MPLFPVFIDLSDRKVLVIGGGEVATRKVKSLVRFTRNITVVAPEVTGEIRRLAEEGKVKVKRRRFMSSDLKGADLVIVAVDDERVQKRVYELCRKRGVLCNAVDSPEWCTFVFPSLIVRGDLVIGISTSGKAPALSRRVREMVERSLPENIEEVLRRVSSERSSLKKGRERQRKIVDMVNRLLPLD